MKRTNFSKRIKLVLAALVIATGISAQTTVKHIVERGETIETIAQKYGVTKDAIIQNNPDAAQFVYVGMELVVPVEEKQNVNTVTVQQTHFTNVESRTESSSADNGEDKWTVVSEIGLGFIPEPDGENYNNHFTFEFTVGAKYNIVEGLYGSARIGYNLATVSSGEASSSVECDYSFIEFPLELGYSIQTYDKKFALTPFGGFDFNIGVKGKVKEGTGSNAHSVNQKIGGKLAMGARVGVRLRLWGFNVSGAYHFHVNKKYKKYFGKDSYPEISIGWGF